MDEKSRQHKIGVGIKVKKPPIHSFFLVFAFLMICLTSGFSQQTDIMGEIDSLMQIKAEEPAPEPIAARPSIERNIRSVRSYILELNNFAPKLQSFPDTAAMNEIVENASWRIQLIEQTIKTQGSKINLRYISALEDFLVNTKSQLQGLESQIIRKSDELLDQKNKLDSIKRDDLFAVEIPSSQMFQDYEELLRNLKERISKADSTINSQRLIVAGLQSKVSYELINSRTLMETIILERQILERNLFKKEDRYLWQSGKSSEQGVLINIIRQSYTVNVFVISNYLRNNQWHLVFLLVLLAGFYRWLKSTIKSIETEKEFAKLIFDRTNYIHKYPLLSSILVVVALSPFIFPNPPISFFTLLVFIAVSISGILLRKRFDIKLYRYWLGLFFIFALSCMSNLYWEVAFREKWHLLSISIVGILLSIGIIKLKTSGKVNFPDYALKIFKFYIGFQIASMIAIFVGRFSLGKMIGVTGTISLMHISSLIIFTLIIKEFIYLLIELSKKNESSYTSLLDFKELENKINRVFSLLAFTIWGYYFFESLFLLDAIFSGMLEFLETPRTLLNATFTYGQIVIFFIAVYAASFLANTVSYFLSIRDEQLADSRNKRFGSYILLIRLGIFTLGFLIAVALTGISLDKITIVLGALTLGISFGLQNIVNNLVSGIILAFERPIQIGDTVQVGSMEGIVKEVGIRASKIQNWEGAEVIIPNGDMLAQHLINWTLSDKKRRVELIIGVSYNSDMDLVTKLIHDQLNEPEMLEHPPKRVFLQSFADNSVNFRVLFWVNDSSIWLNIRDKVMRNIFKSFKDNNVEIPFPQRDLHIKGFPGLLAEKLETVKDIIEEDSSRPKVEKEDQGKAKPD